MSECVGKRSAGHAGKLRRLAMRALKGVAQPSGAGTMMSHNKVESHRTVAVVARGLISGRAKRLPPHGGAARARALAGAHVVG